MQVPNQTLMSSDIVNVTQSRELVDRLTFEVDMPEMQPDLCDKLAEKVLDMMNREEPRRLFNHDFIPASYIVGVANPLKYTVRSPDMLSFLSSRVELAKKKQICHMHEAACDRKENCLSAPKV